MTGGRVDALPGEVLEIDVLVVGCGPVGAAIGNLLGRYGVAALVIDRDPHVLTHPRAIALDHEALRILQLVGLEAGAFATVAIPKVRMWSPYVGEFGQMNSAGETDGHPKLVTFYQPELERVLRRRLAQYSSIEVRLGTAVEKLVEVKGGVEATLRSAPGAVTVVRARYVVGADGASSSVRSAVGVAFKGKTYGQDWLIVDARDVPTPIDHVEFLCDPKRPTPHMVAPDGRQRWEFMLQPGETRQQMETDDKVAELLAPWGTLSRLTIERRAVYRFHARVAERFSRGRVFLAGDAAHLTPPFAGQGLVAGLRDAANLAWKLAWVVKGRAAPEILDTYDQERRPHAREMVRVAVLLGNLIMPRSALLAYVIHGSIKTLRRLPAVRTLFDDMGLKPKNRFARGLFVRASNRSHAVLHAGAMLPQAMLRRCDGATCLSDDALGPTVSWVGLNADPCAGLEHADLAALESIGGRAIWIHPVGRTPRSSTVPVFEDTTGTFTGDIADSGLVALVRPDGCVVHVGRASDAVRVLRDGLRVLAPRGTSELGDQRRQTRDVARASAGGQP